MQMRAIILRAAVRSWSRITIVRLATRTLIRRHNMHAALRSGLVAFSAALASSHRGFVVSPVLGDGLAAAGGEDCHSDSETASPSPARKSSHRDSEIAATHTQSLPRPQHLSTLNGALHVPSWPGGGGSRLSRLGAGNRGRSSRAGR